MWIHSILTFWLTSDSSLTYVVGCQFCILFIHRIVFKSFTFICHFFSICSSFTLVSFIAFVIFHSKNSVLGSSCFESLFSNFFKALSVDFIFNIFFSFPHHFITVLVFLLYGNHLAKIKSFTSTNSELMNSFFSFSASRFCFGIFAVGHQLNVLVSLYIEDWIGGYILVGIASI